MSVFVFVVVIIFLSGVIAPIAKGMGRRLAKGGPAEADLQRLVAELERTEQRLADAEKRLGEAEDRLDFQERLLSSRSSARD